MRPDLFGSVFRHYVTLALERAGVGVDPDTYAEIDAALEELGDLFQHLHDRVAGLERRDEPTDPAEVAGAVETLEEHDNSRKAYYAMLHESWLASRQAEEEE